ncbi:MAG: hypothetical protein KF912_10470 [Phycisphaeraceae bacterium]|nr:hypothetical protein [Phycisphaeraceae bacterium]MBX3367722.1 hypothetical protein [Phycisphaeraceae bacterium]
MAAFQALRRNTTDHTIESIDGVVGVGGFIKYVDGGAATFDSVSDTLAASVGGVGAVADDAIGDLALSTAATLRRGAGPDGVPDPDDLRSVREAAQALPLGMIDPHLRHVASTYVGADKAFRSWEEFQYARFLTAPVPKHRDALIAMRTHPDIWPVPAGTKMQKVIPGDMIDTFILESRLPTGFIARHSDAGDGVFGTSGAMIDGLALPGHMFSDRSAVGIIEWDLVDSDELAIPFSKHFGGTLDKIPSHLQEMASCGTTTNSFQRVLRSWVARSR